ncbi:type I-E CRISPR-associated protein Cse2/CasB [Streptomyces sp. NPDC102381]|uniref:type I-E CRISPR-associated protein Cse2/CasB n=1 Tax=Streptomyces sp. NPDC102381 TaxID=3366164 RepID=UPI00382FCA3C
MPSREQRREHYDRYVAAVRTLCRTLAHRKTLANGRGRDLDDCPDLTRLLIKPSHGFGARRAHYTVAALIALEPATPYPSHSPDRAETDPTGPDEPRPTWRQRPTLGHTFARAARTHRLAAGGLERELGVLTRLSAPTLHPRLPHTARRLLDLGARPDWAVLLDDLALWDYHPHTVARRWREAFYLDLPTDLLQEN